MTATEARAKLESYVVILKEKLEGVTEGPWYWRRHVNRTWLLAKGGLHRDTILQINEDWGTRRKDSDFIAFSRQAVPAMLKLIQDVLSEEKAGFCSQDPAFVEGWESGQAMSLITMAQAMEPWFKQKESANEHN